MRTKQGGSVDKTQDRKGVRTTIPDASYYSPKICVQLPNIRRPYAALVPSATGRPRRPCRGRFEKENTAGGDGEIVPWPIDDGDVRVSLSLAYERTGSI